jgi:deoxyribodipyrimidine photo-lyase
MKSIVIFNNDFRIEDNQALYNACKNGEIIPVFILDEDYQTYGAANKAWLFYALTNLSKSLNNKLILLKQKYKKALFDLIEQNQIQAVYWNRCYEPKMIKLFADIKSELKEKGLEANSYNSSLLFEPTRVVKDDGTFYKVFTPFYKKSLGFSTREVLPKPEKIEFAEHNIQSLKIDDLELLPKINWHENLVKNLDISEAGALDCLNKFIDDEKLKNYSDIRDIPMLNGTSYLSAYLRFGQISPNMVINIANKTKYNTENFVRQLTWRDFSYYISYHFNKEADKDMGVDNFNSKFDNWIWSDNAKHLKAWQTGTTGIALVDAGMRELYNTGYMHNRVRMVAASLLIKNMNINWRLGKQWFDDCLLDADVAINAFSWQWVAGSGCDASPYFRVFNPNLQLDKFDKTRTYVTRHIKEYGTTDYPMPIIDISATSTNAKIKYKEL